MRLRGAGHRDGAARVGQAVGRLVLDRRPRLPLLHAGLETAALDHEILDDAVKDRAVVRLVIHIGKEILDRLRRFVCVQFDGDRAETGLEHDVGGFRLSHSDCAFL